MSFVTWSPPIGSEAVWRIAPREDRDVGGAGTDVDQAHAEFALVGGQDRRADATAAGISSSTCSPQRLTHLVMFCDRADRAGDECTFASRRTPLMPIG